MAYILSMKGMRMADKKELKEIFRKFLKNLDEFLNSSTLKIDEDLAIFTIYLQEPQDLGDELYARGIIVIGRHSSPMVIRYYLDFDDIEISSKFFKYHLKSEQIKEFLSRFQGD